MLAKTQLVVGVEVQGVVLGGVRVDRVQIPGRIGRSGLDRQLHIRVTEDA